MLLLRGGVIVDPVRGVIEGKEIFIKKGSVVGISGEGDIPVEGDFRSHDVTGLHLFPGFIDIHTHLREPGFEWKEDIVSGTRSAVAGGFTAVACMANTEPVNDNPETTRFIVGRAKREGVAKVYPVAAITRGLMGKALTDFGELIDAGAVAFSDDGNPVDDALIMRRAMDYGKMFDVPLILHEEDRSMSGKGCVNEGEVSARRGLPSIPSVSEEIVVARDIILAGYTGARVHFAHMSSRGSVRLIREGKKEGIQISAETAPHYLSLTEEAADNFETSAKMNPPLRSQKDREALLTGISDGTIDCIATDHAPHEKLVKDCEFQEAAFGIIGHQTAFSLVYEEGGKFGIKLNDIANIMSYKPAKILGIDGGRIVEGGSADITVIDLGEHYIFKEEMIESKSHNSPFIGREMLGKVKMTIVDGKVRYREGVEKVL